MNGLLSDEEYDARLLRRMQRDTGRTTMPSWEEQRAAWGDAARQGASIAGEIAYDLLVPQTPLDLALMAALGPGGRATGRLLQRAGAFVGQRMLGLDGEQPSLVSLLQPVLPRNPFEERR